jgi:arabinogalactan oligomer/maltooligosaccharide transport system substrate-binding protein
VNSINLGVSLRRRSKFAALVGVFIALIAGLLIASPSQAAPRPILVWVEPAYKEAARALFANGYKNRKVQVRVRELSTIVTDLQQIDPNKAPDIILIENEQVGELADAALITPLELSATTARSLSSIAINSFKYGEALYGVPMQRQNVALITNATMIPTAPKTFKQLSRFALRSVANGTATIPFALPQGLDGDAYSTYPLFAGLGGFVYGTTGFGSVNTRNVGINNKKFRKNQALIDSWNTSGLINSALTAEEARDAFLQGKSPFWIAGPEEIANLKTVNFRYRITMVPTIVKGINTSPFMKSIGFVVTSFASTHKVLPASRDLVTNLNTTATAQNTFYGASPYVGLPANTSAAAASPDRVLLAFGSAAIGATPYPNVTEWGLSSRSLAAAWRDSTRGGDAVSAAQSFAAARAQVIAARQAAAAAEPAAPAIP